jgi:amino acid transporter
MVQSSTTEGVQPQLQAQKLSQWETLGQSLASVAPTATPALVAPLVLAASGKASWIAYLLATIGIACIAFQVNLFAEKTSSPGSLYSFVHDSLGKWPSLLAGWALVIAYAGTASAVTGGVTSYAWSLSHLPSARPGVVAASSITAVAVLIAAALAYRDVQISARVMLWIEASSILLILALFLWPGEGSALRVDRSQLQFAGTSIASVRSGLVLAIFSFVGFESAASLGSEAVNPRKTIPRAIRWTALVSGAFFIFTAYAENIGFQGAATPLQQTSAPLQLLAHLRGLPAFAPLLAIGSVVSFFACTLACITAGARTLFGMSHDGYISPLFGRAHASNRTPHAAVILTAILAFLPAVVLTIHHVSPFDVYGWLGTVATDGFVSAYLLVSIAAFRLSYRDRTLTPLKVTLSLGSFAALVLALWSALDPSAPGPYNWLPYAYLVLLFSGLGISYRASRPAGTSCSGGCCCSCE